MKRQYCSKPLTDSEIKAAVDHYRRHHLPKHHLDARNVALIAELRLEIVPLGAGTRRRVVRRASARTGIPVRLLNQWVHRSYFQSDPLCEAVEDAIDRELAPPAHFHRLGQPRNKFRLATLAAAIFGRSNRSPINPLLMPNS